MTLQQDVLEAGDKVGATLDETLKFCGGVSPSTLPSPISAMEMQKDVVELPNWIDLIDPLHRSMSVHLPFGGQS